MPGPHASARPSRSSFGRPRVHRFPRPTFVTIAKRPSSRVRDARNSEGDLPDGSTARPCGRLTRRANQPRRPKSSQVKGNCLPRYQSRRRPRARGDPYAEAFRIGRAGRRSSLPLMPVVMGPCFRRDDNKVESLLDTPTPRFVNRTLLA
jgi:hypothetical protein